MIRADQQTGSREALIESIRAAVIGNHHELEGPFGPRLVTYADYTASGRSLHFIEDMMRAHIMPYYANTHTESSGTGLQTTTFREDARAIIADAVGATEHDAVIFAGSGATGAIAKLIEILNLRLPADLNDQYALLDKIPPAERPVVFIGPYEHHSNELPWRESIADVVVIDEDENGQPDLVQLENELKTHAHRPLKIGSFSAASNVTGISTDTRRISALLHAHGALAFWDFAAAGPYVDIDMSASGPDAGDHKDAIFLSPHKFIGGPGTPGVLVVKRALLKNRVPSVPGGGTVSFVSPTEHRYLVESTQREEGGTPDILGAIRAGLVFQLKRAVGIDFIRQKEAEHLERALSRFDEIDTIRVLGKRDAPRLSIVSFMVHHQEGYLHHNFVVRLLNDLFGVQARGGCSCAGPYGHRLLGIDMVHSAAYRDVVLQGCEGIKPGWTRVNLNYFISEKRLNFILDAIAFVATEGWRFLPLYRFNMQTGLWTHRDYQARPRMRLSDVRYEQGRLVFDHPHHTADDSAYAQYLDQARALAKTLPPPTKDDTRDVNACGAQELENLRWFPLPHETRA